MSEPRKQNKETKKTETPLVAEQPRKNKPLVARLSQTDVPKHGLEESVELAKALYENYNGAALPHDLANALSISPTSSVWRTLPGAAVAFGLTEGAANASEIKLSPLGQRVVAPTEEGDDIIAMREATLKPRVLNEFFKKYDRGKFPQENIAINVLTGLGVPKERAVSVYSIAREAGLKVGLITNTKTGLYVSLAIRDTSSNANRHLEKLVEDALDQDEATEGNASPSVAKNSPELPKSQNNRVFITHGKNRSIVEQLREILKFGRFEPVVAMDHETPSKPVPDKVMDDMRSCYASVIHVDSEQELLTPEGAKIQKINENVLIEIGASMALYKSRFVLLVKKGIALPSNLQGLYCCFYEGDRLDYEATMKLLKAFNEF